MQEHAEVIRLESQLTVPTRGRAHLSDVWVSIAWSAMFSRWVKEFEAAAEQHNAPVTGAGSVHLVPMSDQKGWIVTRGVDLSRYSPADVESAVRGLVSRVNRVVDLPLAIAGSAPSTSNWSLRIRGALRATGIAAAGLAGESHRRAEIDAPTRG